MPSPAGRSCYPGDARTEYTVQIASQLPALYDRLLTRGEVPVAREQRKLAAILAADVVG